jgi:hypothetical protein
MNRTESSATHQVSDGVIEPLAAVTGTQLISCTPAAFLATFAALFVTTYGGGFDAADPNDVAGTGVDQLDALSSDDLVDVSRTARSGR